MFRRAGSAKYQNSSKPGTPTYASELDGNNVVITQGTAGELRNMVKELALVPFLGPQWFQMVRTLNDVALFARQEAVENSSYFKGDAAAGTVWDTGDTTCAFLIEEGKLNVCLRLIGEFFAETEDKDSLGKKVQAATEAQGLDATTVRRYLNVFEQSLGQILAFALEKPESLQILDLPLLVSYCSHVLSAVLEGAYLPLLRASSSNKAGNRLPTPGSNGADASMNADAREGGASPSLASSQPSSPLSRNSGSGKLSAVDDGGGGSPAGCPVRLHRLSQGALVLHYLASLGKHLDALGEDAVMSEYRRCRIVPLLVVVLASRYENYDDADIFEACKALGHACDSEVVVTHRDWFFNDIIPELLSLKAGPIARLEGLASGSNSHNASMGPTGGKVQRMFSSDSRAIRRTLQPLLDMINFYERGVAKQ
eukprot:jgi/Mesvir1/27623/Mv07355-RA.1